MSVTERLLTKREERSRRMHRKRSVAECCPTGRPELAYSGRRVDMSEVS